MSWINLVRLTIGLAIALAVGTAIIATVRAGSRPTADPDGLAAVARTRRRTLAWRLFGLTVGIGVGVILAAGPRDWLGLGPGLAGPAFALCLLAGVILGEVTGRPPTGATRTVTIEVRAARQFLPPTMTWSVAGYGVALVGLLSATTAFASADDQGRTGRFLYVQCGLLGSEGRGPWPGSFYSVPIGATVLFGLAVAGLALRAVVRRPRPQADERGRRADDQVRRSSARAIVAACGVLITVPLAGSALVTGMALSHLSCGPSVAPVLGGASLGLAGLAALGLCTFLAVIVFPEPPPVALTPAEAERAAAEWAAARPAATRPTSGPAAPGSER